VEDRKEIQLIIQQCANGVQVVPFVARIAAGSGSNRIIWIYEESDAHARIVLPKDAPILLERDLAEPGHPAIGHPTRPEICQYAVAAWVAQQKVVVSMAVVIIDP
jgi:hypothetical protein